MTGPKTVTPKQLAANRRNAQRSTGPRTAKGKSQSRWNALKHGVLAKAIIPQHLQVHESHEDFDRLLATLRHEFEPQSAIEEMLVESVAASYWRLARLRSCRPETGHRPCRGRGHLRASHLRPGRPGPGAHRCQPQRFLPRRLQYR